MAQQLKSAATAARVRARRVPAPPKVEQVGPWALDACVYQGRDCMLYRARPIDAPPDVRAGYALKLLRHDRSDDPLAVARLRREARVARDVRSPHLLAVVAAQLHDAPYYVAMPWIEGESLAALLGRTGPFDVSRVLWIGRQIAQALDAIDRAGWIHGDVKPSNILLAANGHATLIDLGFAHRANEPLAGDASAIAGTVPYLPPEVLAAPLRSDIRGDIYCLGASLYECLTGRPPYQATSLAELAQAQRQTAVPDVRSIAPNVPSHVASLIHASLASEPLRRPQTPAELVERLVAMEIELMG